jgi:hypothetical protein
VQAGRKPEVAVEERAGAAEEIEELVAEHGSHG